MNNIFRTNQRTALQDDLREKLNNSGVYKSIKEGKRRYSINIEMQINPGGDGDMLWDQEVHLISDSRFSSL